ncbi:CubicO group peptidase (beta-lactamase class C family)/catechol 2,3-dioxygenase-like lactoylglutathione lyase family enzyme [Planomicrobium sp. HSC-17F08]|nr:CubicO group peptidase (beta-lactamase class C family)/catechol 2,3-dioxygenase-like lactoylglutathione lyase family enzyme [Planomicrobium sp. HSC-17F08]
MFKKVTLYTNRLNEMKGFYEYQLGFRIVEEDDSSFTLAIGDSLLVFKTSERAAIYHFAFNIPGNQYTLAKGWASSRVALNRQEGMDEIYYANFNADAFYFQDPAGNVVEFIARRHIDRMGDFTVDSLLNISEVSITTDHVEEVGGKIEAMEIPVRGNKGIEPNALNFLGKDDAFILLVAPKRTWYFSKQKSEVHPLSIELADGRQIDISEDGLFQEVRPSNPIADGMENLDFSGVAMLKSQEVWSMAKGFADRSNERPNALDTRFGIASGCKIFTATAICQLVEEGKLSFEDRLPQLLPEFFPNFDVTIHQLLTHTSGIPDYFDEETMDDFEEIWAKHPMYLMQSAVDFVPLFKDEPMKFAPGERFQYNNAGFIVLGLIVEKAAGQTFTDFVEENIFARAGMEKSGYFRLDRLPKETAFGYIEEENSWRTNQYAIPIKGGADGGAFVTAGDMASFWESLMDFTLLSEEMTKTLLAPHVAFDVHAYGYGVWIARSEEAVVKYHVTGYDPGVSFHSGYYPDTKTVLTVLSNKGEGAADVMKLIEATALNHK